MPIYVYKDKYLEKCVYIDIHTTHVYMIYTYNVYMYVYLKQEREKVSYQGYISQISENSYKSIEMPLNQMTICLLTRSL